MSFMSVVRFCLRYWLVLSALPVSALTLDGTWQQGGILRGKTAPTSQLEFLGNPVKVTQDGQFVIGLGRDAPPEVTLIETDRDGQQLRHVFAVIQRQYDIQKVNGVPAKTVNPPPEALAKIREESAATRRARADVTARLDFLTQFQWPLLGPITGVYGSQRVYNGVPKRPHYGVDVAMPTGTQVVAPAGGKVTLARDDMYFSGGTLIVDHGYGLSSTFMHLSKLLVHEGDEIRQGQPIAEVGASGRATGPHLDWRMNWMDQRVDPQVLVLPMDEATVRH